MLPSASPPNEAIYSLWFSLVRLLVKLNQENDAQDGNISVSLVRACFVRLVLTRPRLADLGQLFRTVAGHRFQGRPGGV